MIHSFITAARAVFVCTLLLLSVRVTASHTDDFITDTPDESPVIGTIRNGQHIKMITPSTFFTSELVDFVQFNSSITNEVRVAAAIYKPESPSPILLVSHGWHGSVERPESDTPNPYPGFLTVQVDMRGRAYSSGEPDANGYELYDFFDALKYVQKNYSKYIDAPRRVHFLGESGGGGNALAIAARFPDLFASVIAKFPISNYAAWYDGDRVGEFRDEMDIWIGTSPCADAEAYAARSGITALPNVLSPVYLLHGETDIRVPSSHSRNYAEAAALLGKPVKYKELKNVGSGAHLGNITPEQSRELNAFVDAALTSHTVPPTLPHHGLLVVPGYVRTQYFEVMLDSVNQVGLVAYDIDKKHAELLKGTGSITFF